jgi:hypothetical protein
MRNRVILPLIFMALAIVGERSRSQDVKNDRIPNWEYTSWASCKIGTTVITKTGSMYKKTSSETTTSSKLVEIKDDALVLELTKVTTFTDGTKPVKEEGKVVVPKKIAVDSVLPLDPKTLKPSGTYETGNEKITINGTKYDCVWYKFKVKGDQKDGTDRVEGQIWICEAMPGRIVKATSEHSEGIHTLEVEKITIPKEK